MSANDTIVAVEIQEQEFGEKVVLESPFEAKDFIKVLPWKAYSEELEENGSLKQKAVSRGMGADNVAIKAVEDYEEQEGFSDDFATHVSWDPDALGPSKGAWTIDVSGFEQAADFFEFCGFEVDNQTSL
jgi:hypothetical protein